MILKKNNLWKGYQILIFAPKEVVYAYVSIGCQLPHKKVWGHESADCKNIQLSVEASQFSEKVWSLLKKTPFLRPKFQNPSHRKVGYWYIHRVCMWWILNLGSK